MSSSGGGSVKEYCLLVPGMAWSCGLVSRASVASTMARCCVQFVLVKATFTAPVSSAHLKANLLGDLFAWIAV